MDRLLQWLYRRLRLAETRRLRRQLGFIGEGVLIEPGVVIWSPSEVRIEKGAAINELTFIYGSGGVFIGPEVMIGANCVISTVSHPIALSSRSRLVESPVRLGARVWLGAGCIILPGVEIGENSVIGAGSVVTKSLPPNVVAAGVPAEIKRQLSAEELAGSLS
jgi:galactoside O-acetyltransferase